MRSRILGVPSNADRYGTVTSMAVMSARIAAIIQYCAGVG
jgi:hypothetical protein